MTRLALVMTQDVGFSKWKETGLLDRELDLYRSLKNVQTSFFHTELSTNTYDGFEFKPISSLADYKPDIIKSNQIDGAEAGLKVSRQLGIPFILRCGYSWAEFMQYRPIRRWTKWRAYRREQKLACSASVCVVSNGQDKRLFEKKYGVESSKIRVHPNWVNLQKYVPIGEPEPRTLIAVGRLVDQKNHALLIEAAAQIKNIKLTIIGEGHGRNELTELAKRLNVDLTLPGILSHEEVMNRLSSSAVFILSSDFEGLPKSLLEAMALALPVVTTKFQGWQDVVESGVNGFVVETNILDLANGIELALSTDSKKMGQKALEKIESTYSLAHVANLEQDLFKELLK